MQRQFRTAVIVCIIIYNILLVDQVFANQSSSSSDQSILVKFLLFFSGHFGWFLPILCIFLLFLAGFFLYLGGQGADAKIFKLLPWLGPRKPRGYERRIDTEDEYSRLLEIFGLTDSATEEDIKHAYREMVKRYHPDSYMQTTELETAEKVKEFDELKRVYERILEMQKGKFGGY